MQSAWLDVLVKINEDILFLDTDMMSGKKKEKLLNYIKVLEEARNKVVSSNNPKLECIYKEYYYDLFVNKAASKLIIKDQKESLDKWINYFLWDEKGKNYSAIEMYWVLEGLSKLGKYDKKNNKYLKRDKKTLYPFALLDKKALEETIALLNDYLENKTGPSELKDALGQANFKRLYEYSLNKKKSNQTVTNTTEGIWKKYDQGSDYNILKEDELGEQLTFSNTDPFMGGK